MSVTEAKKKVADALAAYHEIAHTAPADELREASIVVEEAQKALSDTITAGAKPCPLCGSEPHGMEQPAGGGRVEYEIGCIPCEAFEHTDGTVRLPSVRGGMLPKHAVEAWNEGPDAWRKATKAK